MKNKGFTLLEVLVTVVILAIGLLGLAGLQVNGLRNNLSAEQRGQAAQLAYDMSDRIRSNKADAILASASAYLGTPVTTAASVAALSCNTTATACSPSDIAKRDIYYWGLAASEALPSPVTSITEAAGIFTITVNWDDNRDGSTDASDAPFSVSVQP